jgi:hypothetical protein
MPAVRSARGPTRRQLASVPATPMTAVSCVTGAPRLSAFPPLARQPPIFAPFGCGGAAMAHDDRKRRQPKPTQRQSGPPARSFMSDTSVRLSAVGVRFARSATRHRVSKKSICHVIAHCGLHLEEPPPETGAELGDPRRVFLGDTADGSPVEVIAVESSDGELLVIHAMALRDKYRPKYEEAKRWRR